jgi:Phosphate-starvation-inducible E family
LGLPSHASLGDILPLFIYLEFGAMVGIYFKTTRLPVRYLMYIAMTALGRVLIEIVGAEHRTGMVILIIAGAILVVRNSGSQVWRVERKRSMNNSQRCSMRPTKDRGALLDRRSLSEFRKDRLLSAMTPKREEGQVRIL